MIIKCISIAPNEEQGKKLGKYYIPELLSYDIEPDKIYIVFGLSIRDGAPWALIENVFHYLYLVPLCLFEIIDARVPKYWEMRLIDNDVLFRPPSFFPDYFIDQLSDGLPEVVKEFKKMKALMVEETRKIS